MTSGNKPKVLGSDAFLDSEAPYWENETRIHLDSDTHKPEFRSNRLDEFPLIEDFEVRLEDTANAEFGYHVLFFSRSRGYIAGFPWWDHAEADLIKPTFQIPFGDVHRPFSDGEQGWTIEIAAQEDFVYVLQGDDDFREEGFYAWFKVERSLYLAAWQKTIAASRETFSAEEIFYHDFRPQKPLKPSLANEKVRLQLAKRIAKVFANVPFPGIKTEDIGQYSEVGKVIGKKWQELTLDNINSVAGLHYFELKALHYYLPAFLKYLLLQPDQVNSMTRDSLLDVLTPKSPDWKERDVKVEFPFSAKQKDAIRAFIEGYEELFPFEDKDDVRRHQLQNALDYWQAMAK